MKIPWPTLEASVRTSTEQSTRRMRDAIYGRSTDHNWNECKHNWLRPDSIRWLQEQVKKLSTLAGEMK